MVWHLRRSRRYTPEVESDTSRKTTIDWWDRVMSTRSNDPKTTAKVVVMQRCHQQDLSGHLLEQGGWEHLCLLAEYEGPSRTTSIGFTDLRTEPGELLWPERFGRKEIDELKVSLGSYGAAGQLQQRPSPSGGGMFKRHWFLYYQPRGMNLPPVIVRLPDGTQTSIVAIEAPAEVGFFGCNFDGRNLFEIKPVLSRLRPSTHATARRWAVASRNPEPSRRTSRS
jgi:hypothetical protein